jgi:type VI secretion system protein ImpC
MAQEALSQAGSQAQEQEVVLDDFSALLQKEFKPADDVRKTRIEQAVQTLAEQALSNAAMIGGDVFATVDAMRAALDRKLTEQVNKIIHHEEFQKLESGWRGLHYLVMNTSTGKDMKIRVMNMSKEECRRMFRQYRDAAWDQSSVVNLMALSFAIIRSTIRGQTSR